MPTDIPPPLRQGVGPILDRFVVRHVLDAVWAAQRVGALARSLGFASKASGELAIALSELITNAIKFAGQGSVTVRALEAPLRGLEVLVEDRGPGIEDPAQAILDGYSEGAMLSPEESPVGRRGLGSGLSAANRLSDGLWILAPSAGGTRVVLRKYKK